MAEQELETSASVIRASFLKVAREFNLTPENAPTNPAFIKHADLLKMRERGIDMFGFFENGVQTGFVAVERADRGVFYMEKLAVLPEYPKGSGWDQCQSKTVPFLLFLYDREGLYAF